MTREITFHKMNGLGNDFIIIDLRNEPDKTLLTSEQIQKLSNRKTGIGFDQMVHILPPKNNDGTECYLEMFNADGSFIEACGNAFRCTSSFLLKQTDNMLIKMGVNGELVTCTAQNEAKDLMEVDMGNPSTEWKKIPLSREVETLRVEFENTPKGTESCATTVNVGNPHCVFFCNNIEEITDSVLENFGNRIEHDALFPNRVNVEIIQIIDKNNIRMRVWERGTGITMACGTGACAVFYAAYLHGKVDKSCNIKMDGGQLKLAIDAERNHLLMTGDANYVFKGTIEI